MRLPPKPGPGSTTPREPAFMSGGPRPKKPIKPVMPGKPKRTPGTRVDIMDKDMRVPDEVLKRAPGTKKGMTPPSGIRGLKSPKNPVRVEKVDLRGVDGKPIKEQKPVLFGMAYGGMTKKGYVKGGVVKANCGASMKPTQNKGK